jgi:hypothetical protein
MLVSRISDVESLVATQSKCCAVSPLNGSAHCCQSADMDPRSSTSPSAYDVRALSEDLIPLKVKRTVPVLIRLSLRTAFPFPQRVSTLAPALILRPVPELLGAAVWTIRLLPEQESVLAYNLIQTLFSFRQHTMWIPVRFEWPTAADMHVGAQTLELLVRHQLGVGRGLQRLALKALVAYLRAPIAGRDRKRVCRTLSPVLTSTKRSGMTSPSRGNRY